MSTAGDESTAQPDFLTPPGQSPRGDSDWQAGPHEVSPWVGERRLSAPVMQSRDRELSVIDMDTARNVRRMRELIELLENGTERVIDHTGVELEVPLSRERVAALKIVMDARMKLLDKTMPALKQMDVPDQKQSPRFSMNVKLKAPVPPKGGGPGPAVNQED